MVRFRPLIDEVVGRGNWKDKNAFITGANAILEALLAEYGKEAAFRALEHQGLTDGKGEYGYITRPLYEEAVRRRCKRTASA